MICKLLKYTMMLLLALMVSGVLDSCISDDFVGACPSESEEKTVYLSINVKSDFDISLTRAGGDSNANGTVAGSHSDHLTTDHIAIFFNENETKDGPGKLYAITTLGLPATHEDYNGDAEKEANYMATIRVTKEDKGKIDKGEIVLPKYCLVVLNSGPMKKNLEDYANNPNDVDIEKCLKEIWPSTTDPKEIGFTADGRFTMSNSVYVKNGKVHAAQEISPLNFRNTPDEARRAPVTIYVERLVAKFTFAVINNSAMTRADDDGGIIITPKEGTDPLVFFDQFGNDEKLYKAWPWQVKVTGWGINAQEQKSYLFKNINPASAYFKDWNDERNCRSYWCEDSHYDYEYDKNGNKTQKIWKYPWQYRKAVDKDLESYGINTTNLLKNYSYNDFVLNTKEEVYAPENTYDPSLYSDKSDLTTYLDDRTSLLAGTHLLVCAEMQVDDGNGFSTPEHIYRDRQGIYYESKAQFFKMFVSTINELLKSQRTMDFVLYDWEKGGQIGVKYGEGEKEQTSKLTAKAWNKNVEYKLYYHPDDRTYKELTNDVIEELIENETFDMVSATIEYGDGRVLPWFKDNMLVITDDTNTAQLEIWTRDSIADLNGTFDDNGNPQSGLKIIEGKNVTETVTDGGYYDNCIKSLLCEWFGPIDHFNGGKMYYAAPISHNKSDADGTDKTDDTDDAEQEEKLGTYGVVRNCWYQFTLMGINRIGTPVDDPGESIVPELINIKDVINSKTNLHVWPWHEEETVADIY